jgi:hypothetical protein
MPLLYVFLGLVFAWTSRCLVKLTYAVWETRRDLIKAEKQLLRNDVDYLRLESSEQKMELVRLKRENIEQRAELERHQDLISTLMSSVMDLQSETARVGFIEMTRLMALARDKTGPFQPPSLPSPASGTGESPLEFFTRLAEKDPLLCR